MSDAAPTGLDEGGLAALLASGHEGPIMMVNFLRYRDRAMYADAGDGQERSGREAYGAYAAAFMPILAAAGGRLRWLGRVRGALVAAPAERWDDIVVVEYPSLAAFLTMIKSAAYQAAAVHREAALAEARLFACAERPLPA